MYYNGFFRAHGPYPWAITDDPSKIFVEGEK